MTKVTCLTHNGLGGLFYSITSSARWHIASTRSTMSPTKSVHISPRSAYGREPLKCRGIYDNQGRYADAEPLYRRSLAIWEKALGPEHPSVAASLNNLALLYDNQGRYADAGPLNRRSLAIIENALGPEHPNVATSLNNLAALYDKQGRYADAESLYRRSLAIWEKALGPEHPSVAASLVACIVSRVGPTSA